MAKAHELTIQASLAAIVFSLVRYEMVLGEGIPFGALFSGLQINQISYLWSMEFWGSTRSRHLSVQRKGRLLGVVFVSALLATASGPSSAVLLIPRVQFWPAGSTQIWVNGTFNDLWPDRLDGFLTPEHCAITQDFVASNLCPASEWQKIQQILSSGSSTLPRTFSDSYRVSEMPYPVQLTGKFSMRELYFGQALDSEEHHFRDMVSTTQQAVISDALIETGALWFLSLTNVTKTAGHGSPLSDQSDAIHKISGDYYQPYSAARPVALPYLEGANPPSLINANIGNEAWWRGIVHPGITRQQILETPGPPSQYRLRWLDLSAGLFDGITIGAIILAPPFKESSLQGILLCNIAAGWGTSALQTHTMSGGQGVVSSRMARGKTQSESVPSDQRLIVPDAEAKGLPFDYSAFYPQRHINVTKEWAEFLNPFIPSLNVSVIDLLMQKQAFLDAPGFTAQTALSMLMVNGLSRSGFSRQLQGSVKTVAQSDGFNSLDGNYWLSGKGDVFSVDPPQSKDWVKLRVDSSLQGYSYNTLGTPPKIAIAVLAIYCLFALTHVLYAGISGVSSTCWDSISEVTALAVNSTPTAALRNTCAGITGLQIFKLPVRVLVKQDEEGEGEHLELVFGNCDKTEMENNVIKPNRVYGTMPRLRQNVKAVEE
ncbi:hypothetical protein MMC22_008405 [Lobaria immixta]|nr:hypothetical protein [Lobaria immixta]